MKRPNQLFSSALDLTKVLTERDMAELVRVANELQRKSFSITGPHLMRAVVRSFIQAHDRMNVEDSVSRVHALMNGSQSGGNRHDSGN